MKNNKLAIICISIIIIIVIISGTILLNTYLKEESKKEQTEMELQDSKQNEKERQQNLSDCIVEAKDIRTDLWNSNCPKNKPNCTLNSNIVDWIEKRYKQELENCYQLYGSQ